MNRFVILVSSLLCFQCGTEQSGVPDAGNVSDAERTGDAGRTNAFEVMPPVGAGPVQETAVVALDTKIYLLGGFDENLQIHSRFQVYDTTNRVWSTLAALPEAVHHANMAVAMGKIYVLGAMNLEGFSFRAIGSSYVYDPVLDQWEAITSMPKGSERGAAAMGVIDGKIYLAGGLGDGALASFSSYDPALDTWNTNLPSLPNARDHLMGAVVGGRLYAIGGRSSSIDSVVSEVFSYSPESNRWEEHTPMPTARAGAASGVVNGQIIVVGGEGNPGEPSGVFAQTESYDPIANRWEVLQDMPIPRHGMGAAGIGNTLYIPGGATRQGFAATAESSSFSL